MDVEHTPAGAVAATTRYGLEARGVDFMERTSGSTVTAGYPVYDAHGNTVATLSRSGTNSYAVNDRRGYSAWGDIRTGGQTGDPKGRHCANLGHRMDDEGGYVSMRARYYQPTEGRFLSEDPAGEGTNWFAYCRNNPVSFSDSTGRSITNASVFEMFGMLGHALMFATLALAGAAAGPHTPAEKAALLGKAAATMGVAIAAYAVALGLGTDFAAQGLSNQVLLYTSFGSTVLATIPAFVTGLQAVANAGIASGTIVVLAMQAAICMGELFAQEVEGY